MTIFIVVGMPASGKNTARLYAESKGLPYFSTGDIVRAEVAKRNLDANGENTSRISDEMRGADGLGVTRKALETAINTGSKLVFLEGMRSWQEISLIKERSNAVTIAFIAPRGLRLERIASRGRSDDSISAFDSRDLREIDYGAAVPIALADEYVLNTGSMEDAINSLDSITRKYSK